MKTFCDVPHMGVIRIFGQRTPALQCVDRARLCRPVYSCDSRGGQAGSPTDLCFRCAKDARFHGTETGIHDVAVDSAAVLRSFGILVTTAGGMRRLMYGHAGNHWRNNHDYPARMGVFAIIEKFLFRQRVLLMCSVNAEAAKDMNDILVKASSMKVGVGLEQMEEVFKEPVTVEIGSGGGIPYTSGPGATSSSSRTSCTVGGSRRTFGEEYEKAPWTETNVKSTVPEPTANAHDARFMSIQGSTNQSFVDHITVAWAMRTCRTTS